MRGTGSTKRADGLVEVHYIDETGREWAVLMPPVYEESEVEFGIPLGPIDTSGLDLPESVLVAFHNELFRRRLWNKRDFEKRSLELTASMMKAISGVVKQAAELYRR